MKIILSGIIVLVLAGCDHSRVRGVCTNKLSGERFAAHYRVIDANWEGKDSNGVTFIVDRVNSSQWKCERAA